MKPRLIKRLAAVAIAVLATKAVAQERPNIVLIVGDDIGFADIGCFGSEIETPNLDRLGNNGIRFAQGYNMAKCNPTRSAMLTGTFIGGPQSQSMGELMGRAGYTTLYVGKEHFDNWIPRDRLRAMNSFDYSLCHYAGAGNFFSHDPITYFHNERKLELEEVASNTSKPYYKTNAYTDYALKFLDETEDDGKPFFLYMAYEAAHYPIQALKEDYAKFEGRYDVGWEEIRKKRFEKQKKLGIISPNTKLSEPTGYGKLTYAPWKDVPANEKKLRIEEMTGFAAMVHCLDRNIGRVIQKIEDRGELDNTLILFLSDNGSCAFQRTKNERHPTDPTSYRSLHANWANVGDTPYRLFKQNGHEGGARTHMMAHWPKGITQPSINWDVTHLVDFMPTFLELAGGEYPATQDGLPTPKLDGRSLTPLFKGKTRPDHDIVITGWTEGKRAIRQGDWKAVRSSKEWELYNMDTDPSELDDLAAAMPEKLASLHQLYADWRAERPYLPEKQTSGKYEFADEK